MKTPLGEMDPKDWMALVHARREVAAASTQDPPPAPAPVRGTLRRRFPKRGRNTPCPCGSGRKWKRCHGTNTVYKAAP